jgi:hypothetical protein
MESAKLRYRCLRQLSFQTMAIDWSTIAKQVGDNYGTATGRRALELIVGEGNVRDAVDYWISQEQGCFTAESVLSVMRPKVAMDRCYEIYQTKPDSKDAVAAVFLLASFAEDAALPWVGQFLADRNRDIRWNGLGVLQAILYGPLGDAAIASAMQFLDKAEQDSDSEIRERAKLVRSRFRSTFPYIKLPGTSQ